MFLDRQMLRFLICVAILFTLLAVLALYVQKRYRARSTPSTPNDATTWLLIFLMVVTVLAFGVLLVYISVPFG